jgi:hypothetical protein
MALNAAGLSISLIYGKQCAPFFNEEITKDKSWYSNNMDSNFDFQLEGVIENSKITCWRAWMACTLLTSRSSSMNCMRGR